MISTIGFSTAITLIMKPEIFSNTRDIEGVYMRFHFGVRSISYNCLHDAARTELVTGVFHCGHFDRNEISFRVIKYLTNNTMK